MKVFSFILRVIALPAIIVLCTIAWMAQTVRICYFHLRNGGEFMAYWNDDKVYIRSIFDELKAQRDFRQNIKENIENQN